MVDISNEPDSYDEESYDGKTLKRILVGTNKSNQNRLAIQIGPENSEKVYQTYYLNKIGNINGYNVFDLECHISLYGQSIKFNVDAISYLPLNRILKVEDFSGMNKNYMMKSVLIDSDRNFNHVNKLCKTNLLNPPSGQTSYGVFMENLAELWVEDSRNVSIEDLKFEHSAISLFITD